MPDRDAAVPGPVHRRVLDAVSLTKHFGGVTALDDVSLWALAGEVTALVGENGAGKSTLIKCLSGVYQPDAGEIRVDDTPMAFASPLEARLAGIETVYQELGLVEYFDVAMNIFLGREICRPWWQGSVLDRRAMRRRAREVLAGFGITNVDPSTEVRQLSPVRARRQSQHSPDPRRGRPDLGPPRGTPGRAPPRDRDEPRRHRRPHHRHDAGPVSPAGPRCPRALASTIEGR
jgi:hypothetical protein